MRRRLLISTLAVAIAAVLLLGVPLAFVINRLQVSEANGQVRRDASTLARDLQARVGSGLPPNAEQVARSLPDRYVVIRQYSVGEISTYLLLPITTVKWQLHAARAVLKRKLSSLDTP